MPHDVRKYLFDILQAAEEIHKFTRGKTFSDYAGDSFLRSAVERQFEIIGEAMHAALLLDARVKSKIDRAQKIVDFRNQLIHGYGSIEHETVWGILETRLPLLKEQTQALLTELEKR